MDGSSTVSWEDDVGPCRFGSWGFVLQLGSLSFRLQFWFHDGWAEGIIVLWPWFLARDYSGFAWAHHAEVLMLHPQMNRK
jgi:hypothetical protein